MSSLIPERPAVADYPTASPYQKELDAARAYFHEQLQSSDIEWDSQTKSDVELGAKKDAEDPSASAAARAPRDALVDISLPARRCAQHGSRRHPRQGRLARDCACSS